MIFLLFLVFSYASCELWPKGVVHYTINKKDYDPHSQDVIMGVLSKIEKEICVKFFNTPAPVNGTNDKILNIANPEKRKECPTSFDYSGSLVELPIGYRCMEERSMAQVFVDMLRMSVKTNGLSLSKLGLLRNNLDKHEDGSKLLSAADRNFINAAYLYECDSLHDKPREILRRTDNVDDPAADSVPSFYDDKIWPLGVVAYGAGKETMETPEFKALRNAMSVIEASTCVAFQLMPEHEQLIAQNFLWFSLQSDEYPKLGLAHGNQTVSLKSIVNGAPGHTGHTLSMLIRILGIPMMSNRYDRDNYVIINWKYVEKSKEHFLERAPQKAWITNGGNAPYDFESVTHAPANYMCRDCSHGEQTVQPIQDHLWQRSMTMGHRANLSPNDIELLNLLYTKECIKMHKVD